MKNVYLVTYDISNPKRLRRIFKLMKRFGDHVQFSVFVCRLSERRKKNLELLISDIIEPEEDQVLVFSIGSEKNFKVEDVVTLGIPFLYEYRKPIIV